MIYLKGSGNTFLVNNWLTVYIMATYIMFANVDVVVYITTFDDFVDDMEGVTCESNLF